MKFSFWWPNDVLEDRRLRAELEWRHLQVIWSFRSPFMSTMVSLRHSIAVRAEAL